ncbi:MAG TPA: helical backbone metal receptor, partial [Symbiobacteriaceae bacterium]|nr:helical backbone metal receptor [Symbiobacteriaceae bacterium]
MTRRVWLTLLSLMLVLSVLAGCATPAQETKKAEPAPAEPAKAEAKVTRYPLTLKDALGREVTIREEPKRILSAAPSNTELVYALGKGGALVGRTDFCDFPAEAASVPSIGGFYPPNYEMIVATKPDLVLMIQGTDEAREKLANEYGLTVFVVSPQNFEQVYSSIQTLGTVLNAQEAADKLVADMQKQVRE